MKRAAADSERENRATTTRRNESRQEASASTAQSGAVASLHRVSGNQAVRELHRRGDLRAGPEISKSADKSGDPAQLSPQKERLSVDVTPDISGSIEMARAEMNRWQGYRLTSRERDRLEKERGGGQTLRGPARSAADEYFGRSRTDARIHTGDVADQLSSRLNAAAFAWNEHIFLSQEINTRSPAGIATILHELAHVEDSDTSEDVVRRVESTSKLPLGQKADYGQIISVITWDPYVKMFSYPPSRDGEISSEKFDGPKNTTLQLPIPAGENQQDELIVQILVNVDVAGGIDRDGNVIPVSRTVYSKWVAANWVATVSGVGDLLSTTGGFAEEIDEQVPQGVMTPFAVRKGSAKTLGRDNLVLSGVTVEAGEVSVGAGGSVSISFQPGGVGGQAGVSGQATVSPPARTKSKSFTVVLESALAEAYRESSTQ